MSTWDENIFSTDLNVDFLDEMANLDEEGVIRAVEDACEVAHSKPKISEEEEQNAQAAATIAAIWAGAPFSAGEVVEADGRRLVGEGRLEGLGGAVGVEVVGLDVGDDLDAG